MASGRLDPRRNSTWRSCVPGPGALRNVRQQADSVRCFERQSARLHAIGDELQAYARELQAMIASDLAGPIVPRIRQIWIHALAAQLERAARYAHKIAASHRHLAGR